MEFCRSERDGHLLVVTITRPEVMNALHAAANLELNAVFDEFCDNPELWVAIITGEGSRAFCVGADIKAARLAQSGPPPATRGGFMGLTTRADLEKPVIAAVNGTCVGGGFIAALACDLIVAEEHASFGFPEPRLGGAAIGGGIQRLVRQIPYKQAMDIILTARNVAAAEAHALGFVNEVVPRGEALAAARRWAERLLALAPLAIRASKVAAGGALYAERLPQPDDPQPEIFHRMHESADFAEGRAAFVEKRPPRWRAQ